MAKHGHAHRHLHQKKQKDFFDYILYLFMVATPLFEVPQAWKIYSTQSAADVSLTTWGFFVLSNFVWIAYAVRNKLLPLIITYCMYLVIELVIVIGIIMYS